MHRYQPPGPKVDARGLDLRALSCRDLLYLIEIANIEMERRERLQQTRLSKAEEDRPQAYARAAFKAPERRKSRAWREAESIFSS